MNDLALIALSALVGAVFLIPVGMLLVLWILVWLDRVMDIDFGDVVGTRILWWGGAAVGLVLDAVMVYDVVTSGGV